MRIYFQKLTFLTLLTIILASFIQAQENISDTPREETLLNGLKVLIWNKPNTGRVSVNLRIHSGSAFDPENKEGTIALLSDILFPDVATRKYFEEDLEGKLEVITTYDYIQVNTSAKSDEFLAILEILAPAISNPQIDAKTLEKVKKVRLEKVLEMEKDPGYIADLAVAERLFGDFPYGRSIMGTSESLAKIDFADLVFAKQRLLNADNATLTITGDVPASYAYRAARRLLGGWQKGFRKIPANFRLPTEPDEAPLTINLDEGNTIEDRYAINAAGRTDKEFYPTEVLTEILNERFQKISEQKGLKKASVKMQANFLRGSIVFAKELDANNLPLDASTDETLKKNARPNEFITKLFTEKISQSEFDSAKNKVLARYNKISISDLYFEIDTYKLDSISKEVNKVKNISLKDVQRVALNLSKNKIVDVSVSTIENAVVPDSVLRSDPKDPVK